MLQELLRTQKKLQLPLNQDELDLQHYQNTCQNCVVSWLHIWKKLILHNLLKTVFL